jgi:hypothetical protein
MKDIFLKKRRLKSNIYNDILNEMALYIMKNRITPKRSKMTKGKRFRFTIYLLPIIKKNLPHIETNVDINAVIHKTNILK